MRSHARHAHVKHAGESNQGKLTFAPPDYECSVIVSRACEYECGVIVCRACEYECGVVVCRAYECECGVAIWRATT